MAGKRARFRKVNGTGRNETEGYFKLTYYMARSDAFRSLSGSAIKVYIELRCRFNGANNGHLFLSLTEAARLLGISKSTVQRAFKELGEKGFIKKTRQGSWYGRIATTWAITDRNLNGHTPTNEWKQWHPKTKPRYSHGP